MYVPLTSSITNIKQPRKLPLMSNCTHSSIEECFNDPYIIFWQSIVPESHPYKIPVDALKNRLEIYKVNV